MYTFVCRVAFRRYPNIYTTIISSSVHVKFTFFLEVDIFTNVPQSRVGFVTLIYDCTYLFCS